MLCTWIPRFAAVAAHLAMGAIERRGCSARSARMAGRYIGCSARSARIPGRQVVGEAPAQPAVAIIAHWAQRSFVNRAARSARGDIM